MDLTEEKVDLWTPLHCLLEVANRTNFSKSNSQGTPHAKLEGNLATPQGGQKKSETTTKSETLASVQSAKTKDNGHKAKLGDDKDGKTFPSGPRKRRRVRPDSQKKKAASKIMLDATESRCNGENSAIWFSLVASEDQKGEFPLPQISACYLRIKDGNVPVSFIHKYLAKKLNLASEAEVVITCRGQSLLPSLKPHNIVDLWLCTTPSSKKIRASVGSSAKEFVMVLSYSRNPLPL
uniref:E3 ubiquitin protein ligase DRIP2 n=1 Tax=Lotus japonicus TaxID=34305 RepID=I3SLP6_LOTJA|nr:unknown [Lotus japonicus]